MGATGLPAICENIAATTAPVTPTITPASSSPTTAPAPVTPPPVAPVTPAPVAPVTPAPVDPITPTNSSASSDSGSDSESVSDSASEDFDDSDSMGSDDSDDSMDFNTTETVITGARNSFIGGSRRFRRNSAANAVGSESATVSDLLATDGDSENDHVTISLSKDTLINLWGLCAVVVLMNITLCVWCQCKRNKAAKAQRFVSDDPYESERNVNV